MKKIIIHSFLPKYEDAVYYAYRCLNTSKEKMEEGKSIITFTVNMERRICVTTVKNKDSIRFIVWEDKI